MERPLPYSTWCYVCGKDNPLGHRIVFTASAGRVRVRYTPDTHRQGYRGVVHGGVLCTLLDETMGWAPTVQGTGRLYVTGELTTRFVRPFPVGVEMIVEAWAEKVTSRLALVAGEVRDDEGVLYASATGKFLPMSAEQTCRVNGELIYDDDTLPVLPGGAEPPGSSDTAGVDKGHGAATLRPPGKAGRTP